MMDLLIKFSRLNRPNQLLFEDFLDFLLSKQKKQQGFNMRDYRKKISGVSVWSD